jgi:ribosome biogenesis GTPase
MVFLFVGVLVTEDFALATREEEYLRQREADQIARKLKKQIKRNRQTDAVRQKDWSRVATDDDGMLDTQRIMPRGERQRRRDNLQLAAAAAQGAEEAQETTEMAGGRRGLVVEVSSGLCRVETAGEVWLCATRGALSAAETGMTNVVAVGDQVIVAPDGAGGGVVEEVLPRRSVLARPDVYASHMQQVIVANAEQLLIVASWREPALWFELVDRYLITAQRGGLEPILCLNKIDLAEDRAACFEALRPYRDLGIALSIVSARTGEGVEELRRLLRGRMTALAGLSGVGKSSLLAAVQPDLRLRTAEVSGRKHEGRHTTTQASLLSLKMGGYVIDTPGIREFGLAGLRRGELARYFPEMREPAGRCRFADCAHLREPGCAVREAAEAGEIAATRYDSYVTIYADLAA